MSAPASVAAMTGRQAAMELRLTARRAENLLVTIVVPAAVLLFFGSTSIFPASTGRPVDFLLPGALTLAVISTSLVNLGIATAYERYYGVLKLLGGSPLPRSGLIAAKTAAVLAVELVQVILLVAVAGLVFDWRPGPDSNLALGLVGILLGTLAFAGLGLAMAGSLRAEATLAAANGLFLVFLVLGGIVVPVDHLPAALAAVAGVLPASALSDLLRIALGASHGEAVGSLLLLGAWAIGSALVAARTFRWE
jgi:ABC-2 type transport system permease protein